MIEVDQELGSRDRVARYAGNPEVGGGGGEGADRGAGRVDTAVPDARRRGSIWLYPGRDLIAWWYFVRTWPDTFFQNST